MRQDNSDNRIILTDKITVEMIQQCGGDHMAVASARVSKSGRAAMEWADPAKSEGNVGLINYLTRKRHGTPHEHGLLTLFIHAPAFVWWEWVRHRIGQTVDCSEMSFNLESGRYRQLEPVFWIPSRDRKMVPIEGYKSSEPVFVRATDDQFNETIDDIRFASETAWACYLAMKLRGISNEVARCVLGFGVYYSGWVSMNPRSIMSFLSLRTHEPAAMFPSFPQAEIEFCARAAEDIFAEFWPITHASFCKNGRVGP